MNTTTLEQSKRLKELGAPQDTYFGWGVFVQGGNMQMAPQYAFKGIDEPVDCAAYTLEELIEWLPREYIKDKKYYFHLDWVGSTWLAGYSDSDMKDDKSIQNCSGETPLEAVYNLAIAVRGENGY